MARIDERFLRPSPELAEWLDHQMIECGGCEHVRIAAGLMHETIMRCGLRPLPGRAKAGRFEYCIDERSAGGHCGPAGAFFKPRA